jgi:DNA-binding CsgD family transcriptional regulator
MEMTPERQDAAGARKILSLKTVLNGDPSDDMRRILGLSPREFAIAVAIAEGRSRSELAVEFGCSQHTVDSHIRRIFSKLGVRSKAAIGGRLIRAYRSALIDEGVLSD